ncbi:WD repeat-containing protein 18 [Octopus bimaculoides]|uniref:Uncharacterized protein n=1 Tax=Octopus bimaculoides TaxID=37653 RepID=A0A0L8GQG3_OCTBM|nr:WD repeat-containing protein 18 [Octopus bimaculoides]|eukprot:XP_014778905.1 PREDICTED: WD repeat-containing protein 18-like [Octopus bimaculoides]
MSVLRCSEVIISSDLGSKSSECRQKGSICVLDINSCTALACFREELGPIANGLCLIKKNYLLSASENVLCVWNITNSSSPAIKMEVPKNISSLAVSPDGLYCVAGIQEKLYVWCVLTGQLLSVIQKHFQNIVCIKFADNLTFLTGGEDNQIIAWSLVDIFNAMDNKNNKNSTPEPLFIWHDHTLPITDLYVGAGGIRARIVSSSLDRTCKFWDLATGRLLCSFMFSESLLSVTMNMAENRLYAGGSSGKIYVVDLSQGSANTTDDTMSGGSDKTKFYFLGHSKHVNCLSVSMDGSLLASGSDDCTVKVWDTSNGRCLKTLMHKTAVTNAFIAPVYRSVFETKSKETFPIHKFQTEMMNKKDKISSVLFQNFLQETNVCGQSYPFQSDVFATILAGELDSHIIPSDSVAEDEEQSSRERTETIAKLRKEIDLIKTENEKLFTFSVSQLLK